MVGYPLQHKSCTLCSTWWILSWWWWGRWWHRNISYSPCLQLLALSTKTLTHTQQIRLLPVWHSEYLLLIEWKWITMKVFIPDTFLLRRLRRRRKRRAWPCWVAEMEEQRRWKGRQGKQHTQGTFMEIHCNFCLKVLFFISLKTFLCVISPPSTICFCFRAHIIEGSMPYKSQKQSWELRTLLPDCVMSVCFLALLLLGLLPHHPALVRNHSSPSSLFC